MRKYKTLVVPFCLVFWLGSCKEKTKFHLEIPALNSSVEVQQLSIKQLSKRYKLLDGQYVETEGIFKWGFEELAIYPSQYASTEISIWLEPHLDLLPEKEWNNLIKLAGKKIIVRGRIDTNSRGHLGQYLTTITNIYYLKEK